jgi:TonB family protein
MRPVIAASLLLSTTLVAASAMAAQPKTDAVVTAPSTLNGSTFSPATLDSKIHISTYALDDAGIRQGKVVLALNVDKNGNAQHVRILKSVSPEVDASVVSEVLQSHFQPAKLDNQVIPIELNLIVNVKR